MVPRATHRDIVSLLLDVFWAGVPENQLTLTNKKTAGVFLETLSALAYKTRLKKNGEFVLQVWQAGKQKRKARTGFNPKTALEDKDSSKDRVKFRVAKATKDAVLGVNLIPPVRWPDLRPEVCALTQTPEDGAARLRERQAELEMLLRRLDDELPHHPSLRIEKNSLIVGPLKAKDEQPSLGTCMLHCDSHELLEQFRKDNLARECL